FDHFYGFVGGEANQWQPALYEDTKPVEMEVPKGRGGLGKGGTVTLFVNEKEVAQGRVEKTVPARFSADETFDIGLDTGSPVSKDYESPFAFKGTIQSVKVDLGRSGELQPTGRPKEKSQLNPAKPDGKPELSSLLNDSVLLPEAESARYQELLQQWAL